jgi:hypothetical protein
VRRGHRRFANEAAKGRGENKPDCAIPGASSDRKHLARHGRRAWYALAVRVRCAQRKRIGHDRYPIGTNRPTPYGHTDTSQKVAILVRAAAAELFDEPVQQLARTGRWVRVVPTACRYSGGYVASPPFRDRFGPARMDCIFLTFASLLLPFLGALLFLLPSLGIGDVERRTDAGWRPDFKNRRWKRCVDGRWEYRDMTDRECLDFTVW